MSFVCVSANTDGVELVDDNIVTDNKKEEVLEEEEEDDNVEKEEKEEDEYEYYYEEEEDDKDKVNDRQHKQTMGDDAEEKLNENIADDDIIINENLDPNDYTDNNKQSMDTSGFIE